MGDKMSLEAKRELFRQTSASQEARATFIESWGALINEVLPLETTVRNIFTVEVLPPGTVPVYQVDVQPLEAWVMPKFGQVPQNIIEVEEITVPTFELVSDAEYRIRDAEQGRIDMAAKAMTRLKEAMVLYEETAGWATLRAAATVARTVSLLAEEGLTKNVMEEAFYAMEKNRQRKVDWILVGPKAMKDIRSWNQTTIDPVTQREIFVGAGLGKMYNATIQVVHFLDDDEAYFVDTTPGLLGYMPIRSEMRTFEDPALIRKLRVGAIAHEEIGFAVMDNTAIVKATLNYEEVSP